MKKDFINFRMLENGLLNDYKISVVLRVWEGDKLFWGCFVLIDNVLLSRFSS